MVTLYGIHNCDTVKKARRWLEQQDIEYRFHDFRKDGLDAALLGQWCNTLGWETLLNKRGTTWRQQPDAVKDNLSAANVEALLLTHPAMIKRPVLVTDTGVKVGFKPDDYAASLL
ncbi:ArsC family reductase [Pontibacter sp. JAM-7]|uniref:ArsC family reductase n=1 Tax=Pontibacter sp. JAM-7 TaxID=3366581 RepID=UPI003AF51CBA